MLEDIDRIEVIRGPGASPLGRERRKRSHQYYHQTGAGHPGFLASGTAGNEEGIVSIRQGGTHGSDLHYRLFAK
ncbi:MAG: hypothetical protein R3B83_03890 [Nitrospirales bacterium]|nr:hypothetical protein [Nitrospirales bacterium]